MSTYTDNLPAEELIRYIASDYVELSHEKVRWQRDDFMKICRDWLSVREAATPVQNRLVCDDF